jgi:hypothetical protein
MTSGTLIEPREAPPVSEGVDPRGEYRCKCGHVLRVFGGGRHRVYFVSANARLGDPVMNGACPSCGGGLPGKSRIVTAGRTDRNQTGNDRRRQ